MGFCDDRVIDDLLKNPIEGERYAGEARALIVAPTRELVIQIAQDAELLTKYTSLKIHTLVGGMDYQKQQNRLHSDFVDILVATPGRMLDFRERQDVHLDTVEILVIDEADRMLDMGFIPQMRQIVRYTPRNTHRQTLMFSATFTEEVMRLSDLWMHEPKHIEIASLPSGQPQLILSNRALEIANALGASSYHVSISDEQSFATAFVVLSC